MANKAIVYVEKGKATVQDVSIPAPRDDYILVKVNAVGVNPTDYKNIDFGVTEAGSRMGCDYAGVVEAVGSKVTKPFKKGDRISGMAHGGDRYHLDNGAFANCIVVKGDVQIKTPDTVSDEEAATLGVSINTVGQGLCKALGLPLPTDSKTDSQTIFIHGGSTATGIFGIQLAKLSGLKVITTASPHNFAYLKSLGADAVFDYKIPNIGAEIRSYTDNNLKVAWDCAGSAVELINSSLSSNGGRWGTITPYTEEQLKAVRPDIDGPYHTLAYEIFGEPFRKFKETPAKPDEFEHAKIFWESIRQLLEEGKLKVPRIALNRGGNGLDGVLKGMDDLRAHKVSGEKLVYTL